MLAILIQRVVTAVSVHAFGSEVDLDMILVRRHETKALTTLFTIKQLFFGMSSPMLVAIELIDKALATKFTRIELGTTGRIGLQSMILVLGAVLYAMNFALMIKKVTNALVGLATKLADPAFAPTVKAVFLIVAENGCVTSLRLCGWRKGRRRG